MILGLTGVGAMNNSCKQMISPPLNGLFDPSHGGITTEFAEPASAFERVLSVHCVSQNPSPPEHYERNPLIHGKPRSRFLQGPTRMLARHTLLHAARVIHGQGTRLGVYKPVASGCIEKQGKLIAEDAVSLWQAQESH